MREESSDDDSSESKLEGHGPNKSYHWQSIIFNYKNIYIYSLFRERRRRKRLQIRKPLNSYIRIAYIFFNI